MNNLLEEFIPYELALELKNIGFEEHCFGYYSYSHYYDKYFPIVYIKNYLYLSSKPEIPKDSRLAPTYSQCFKWFRKKHNLESWITRMPIEMVDKNTIKKYNGFIWKEDKNPRGLVSFYSDTYKEAELELLKQLIKICKNE